jgi:hypothetical protein
MSAPYDVVEVYGTTIDVAVVPVAMCVFQIGVAEHYDEGAKAEKFHGLSPVVEISL